MHLDLKIWILHNFTLSMQNSCYKKWKKTLIYSMLDHSLSDRKVYKTTLLPKISMRMIAVDKINQQNQKIMLMLLRNNSKEKILGTPTTNHRLLKTMSKNKIKKKMRGSFNNKIIKEKCKNMIKKERRANKMIL